MHRLSARSNILLVRRTTTLSSSSERERRLLGGVVPGIIAPEPLLLRKNESAGGRLNLRHYGIGDEVNAALAVGLDGLPMIDDVRSQVRIMCGMPYSPVIPFSGSLVATHALRVHRCLVDASNPQRCSSHKLGINARNR